MLFIIRVGLFLKLIGRSRNGDGGGGSGGGHGGLGGGGGGGLGGNRRRRHDRKYFQMMIPGFLAVNAGAWMILALGIVKLLTFKALIISKVALIISVVMTIRKLMERANEK